MSCCWAVDCRRRPSTPKHYLARPLSHPNQGEALDAIIAHVQREGAGPGAQQLAKEQFLTICHLVSAALEAAQTSDALWVEPQLPASAAHKRRHPTLREIVGSRMAEAAEQQVEEAEARTPSPDKPRQPGADSRDRSSKENEAANVQPAQAQAGGPLGKGAVAMAQQPAHSAPAGGSRQASPGKPAGQPAAAVLGVRNSASEQSAGAAGAGTSGVADITDFERKLQVGIRGQSGAGGCKACCRGASRRCSKMDAYVSIACLPEGLSRSIQTMCPQQLHAPAASPRRS